MEILKGLWNKSKVLLFGFIRYGLATLLLLSAIALALVSGAMTFTMYTSNYSEDDVRYIITGGLAVAMQTQVLLLSLGLPIITMFAPQHRFKAKVLLIISFFLSVIGSISFFTEQNEFEVGAEPIYNDVIKDFIHIFTFGLLDNLTEVFQTLIGIWAICFFIEFLVIFLPDLSISIFTGKYKKFINHGLSVKDLLLIIAFSPNRKEDVKKFINIFLKPSIEKVNAKLQEAEGTTFKVDKKKVIDLKGYNPKQNELNPNKNSYALNEKGTNSNKKGSNQKEKVITPEQKVVTIEKGLSKREQASTNHNLIKTWITDKYSFGEEVKKQEVLTKFQLTPKQWQRVLTKLKEESIIKTKGTTSICNVDNKNKKGTNPKKEKVITKKTKPQKKED